MMLLAFWIGSSLLQAHANDGAASEMCLLQQRARAKTCPTEAPEIDGAKIDELISKNQGILIIGMETMRCTQAATAALNAKGAKFVLKQFTGDFDYQPGDNAVWDYLHCKYPDDANQGTTMHSYVFHGQEFLGQGFKAAETIAAGDLDDKLELNADSAADCSHVPDANRSKDVVDNMLKSGPVVMFGWLGCPCVQTAQTRFQSEELCVKERTWANPSDPLMSYLQCKVGDSESHSFIFFKQKDGSMKYVGNGFKLADDAMDDGTLKTLISEAGAKTDCSTSASSNKTNVYGGPLEECRVGTDSSGSWMDDGTCSEEMGGVHQICLEQIPADFSEKTGQSPWSRERAGKRHCVCVGAWSLYMTKEKSNPVLPHCKSIPSTVFTATYIANWKDWNGISADIKTGVSKLVEKCLNAPDLSDKDKCTLKGSFEALQSQEALLKSVKPAGLSSLSC